MNLDKPGNTILVKITQGSGLQTTKADILDVSRMRGSSTISTPGGRRSRRSGLAKPWP